MKYRLLLLVILASVFVVSCTEKKEEKPNEEKPQVNDYPLVRQVTYKDVYGAETIVNLEYSNSLLSSLTYISTESSNLTNEASCYQRGKLQFSYDNNRIYVSGKDEYPSSYFCPLDTIWSPYEFYTWDGNLYYFQDTVWSPYFDISDTLYVDNALCSKAVLHRKGKDWTWGKDMDYMQKVEYMYSRDNECIAALGNFYYASYGWEGGNIIGFRDIQLEYYDEENPFYYQPIDVFRIILHIGIYCDYIDECVIPVLNVFGHSNKNLVKSIKTSEYQNPITIQYSFDGNKHINGIIATIPSKQRMITARIDY